MDCGRCKQTVKVGLAGVHNLEQHWKYTCKGPDKNRRIDTMFASKPRAQLVPPTVTAPPPVNPVLDPVFREVIQPTPTSGKYPAPRHQIFARLRKKLEQIPFSNPWAMDDHPLSIFGNSPAEFFRPTECNWSGTLLLLITSIFNGNVSGEAPNFDFSDIQPLLNRGPKGLGGFCQFFDPRRP
ncbi:hypothetical protein C8R45DRAFT_1096575 [Mycena sanguinolenta]|nr:hypothetical protein C8R45DRAFT_1096575 [Mycena sanguinolenta]